MNTGGGCPNDPGVDKRRQDAKCHVCGKVKSCGFCNICCHWFCDKCRPNIFARAMEAVKELVGGPKPDCCGPVRVMFNLELCELVGVEEDSYIIRASIHDAPIKVREGTPGLLINPTEEEIRAADHKLALGVFSILP